jgi:hypothetical protein
MIEIKVEGSGKAEWQRRTKPNKALQLTARQHASQVTSFLQA